MSLLITILIEFIKIGFFAIGGGMATLPFLYHLSVEYAWFSAKDLAQMLAIANIVPGPVGINLATQVGFIAHGFSGALAAALGILIPSLVCVFIVAKLLKDFEGNRFVKSIFYMLKPASCAMIAAIGVKLIKSTIVKTPHFAFNQIDLPALILLLVLIFISIKKEHSPLFYLAISALAGLLFHIIKSFVLG